MYKKCKDIFVKLGTTIFAFVDACLIGHLPQYFVQLILSMIILYRTLKFLKTWNLAWLLLHILRKSRLQNVLNLHFTYPPVVRWTYFPSLWWCSLVMTSLRRRRATTLKVSWLSGGSVGVPSWSYRQVLLLFTVSFVFLSMVIFFLC